MRTEEEAKYDLDERIFELYDSGMSVENISGRLGAAEEYIRSLLGSVPVETA